jgi:preprotein translocase subunit SecD
VHPALKVLSVLALIVSFVLLREPAERLVTRGELYARGGVRYVFDVEPDRSTAGAPADRVEHTGRVLARRFEQATGRPAFARTDGDRVRIDVPLRSARTLTPELILALAQPAVLELRAVDDDDDRLAKLPSLPAGVELKFDRYSGRDGKVVAAPYLQSKNRESLIELVRGKAPPGREVAVGPVAAGYRTFLVHDVAGVTGDDVKDSRVAFDRAKPYVSVTFNAAGAELFRKMTAAHVGRRIAISLDGVVNSAPVVQTEIAGGVCAIHIDEGKPVNEALREARDLALMFKAGALPARVRLAAIRPIEPRSR